MAGPREGDSMKPGNPEPRSPTGRRLWMTLAAVAVLTLVLMIYAAVKPRPQLEAPAEKTARRSPASTAGRSRASAR